MKKIQRILCFFFAVLTVILSFPVVTSAASTIDATSVYSDLKAMKLDLSMYKKDTSDNKGAKIMYFLEYAFDANNNQSDYGLYIYVYNPTCEVIDKNSFYNTVQLSSFGVNGTTSYSKKYKLIYISSSTEADGEGLANLYYKFKIKVTPSFISDAGLNKDRRCYKLVDLELQYPGELNPRKSRIANEYVCTGFQENHGYSGCLPLSTTWNNLETISVELHPATWKTISSDKDENYQYQVSSVYFNLPNYYLEKYGDITDEKFKGLKSVHVDWYEYKFNGLITNNYKLYANSQSILGKQYKYDSTYVVPDTYAGPHWYVCYDKSVPVSFTCDLKNYNYGMKFGSSSDFTYDSKCLSSLHTSYYYQTQAFKEIPVQDVLDGIYKSGSTACFSYVDGGRVRGHNDTIIDVNGADLNSSISSYAEAHPGLLSKLFKNKLWGDAAGYSPIVPVEMITSDDFNFLSDPEAQANALFVSENDVSKLKEFYDDMSRNDQTVYLMRFAVNDYYFEEIDVYDPTSKYEGTHYYTEFTAFVNFDVLDFTFKNSDGGLTIVPVSSKPITIVGALTPNFNNQSSAGNKYDDVKAAWNGTAGWLRLIILFAGTLVVVFVISKISPLISAVFNFFLKMSDRLFDRKSKRREYRYKDDENQRAWNRDHRDRDANDRAWNDDRRRDNEETRKDKEERRRDKRFKFEKDANERAWNDDKRRDREERRKDEENARKNREEVRKDMKLGFDRDKNRRDNDANDREAKRLKLAEKADKRASKEEKRRQDRHDYWKETHSRKEKK